MSSNHFSLAITDSGAGIVPSDRLHKNTHPQDPPPPETFDEFVKVASRRVVANLLDPTLLVSQFALPKVSNFFGRLVSHRVFARLPQTRLLRLGQTLTQEISSTPFTAIFRWHDGYLKGLGYEAMEDLIVSLPFLAGIRLFQKLPLLQRLFGLPGFIVQGLLLSAGGLLGEFASSLTGSRQMTTPFTLSGIGLRIIDSQVTLGRGRFLKWAEPRIVQRIMSPEKYRLRAWPGEVDPEVAWRLYQRFRADWPHMEGKKPCPDFDSFSRRFRGRRGFTKYRDQLGEHGFHVVMRFLWFKERRDFGDYLGLDDLLKKAPRLESECWSYLFKKVPLWRDLDPPPKVLLDRIRKTEDAVSPDDDSEVLTQDKEYLLGTLRYSTLMITAWPVASKANLRRGGANLEKDLATQLAATTAFHLDLVCNRLSSPDKYIARALDPEYQQMTRLLRKGLNQVFPEREVGMEVVRKVRGLEGRILKKIEGEGLEKGDDLMKLVELLTNEGGDLQTQTGLLRRLLGGEMADRIRGIERELAKREFKRLLWQDRAEERARMPDVRERILFDFILAAQFAATMGTAPPYTPRFTAPWAESDQTTVEALNITLEVTLDSLRETYRQATQIGSPSYWQGRLPAYVPHEALVGQITTPLQMILERYHAMQDSLSRKDRELASQVISNLRETRALIRSFTGVWEFWN